ncbi:hypothetical protein RclHR1_22750003 [Rhizophagus clarus]|uniref:Uncharacterized protein n=1 Tax=Rhizophagus clarus TaxID=94130 RepID=A0A2Z6R8E2_9GLOM|nr:hypothetical protein RclHR1_22750003 [Rhizophagus clarus]
MLIFNFFLVPRLYLKIDKTFSKAILRVQTKPRLHSKVRGWIPRRNFEGPESLLRQTSYLKAHGFPDANKRWERIEVRNSKRKVHSFPDAF